MPRNDKVYNYLQSLENFMPSNEFNNNSPANSTQVMNTDCHNIKDNENQVSEASCHIPHKVIIIDNILHYSEILVH